MEHCLYCAETPASEEHPLSAGLGEFNGAPTLLDRICAQCNSRRIGLLDEQFLRCGPVAILRKRFGIEGREHHDKVNSFYRGSAGGQPIKYLAWDEAFGCEVLIELTGGRQGRQLSQLIIQGQEGPPHQIPLTPTTTVVALRQKIAALKLVAPFAVRLIYDPPTEPWATELFKQIWPDRELPEGTLGATNFKGGVAQFQVTSRYFRAIAKTGFHYFLTQFPNYSGRESFFSDIRDFIVDDRKEFVAPRINQFVGVHKSPIAPPGPVMGHLLCAQIREGVCTAHFEPFITPGSRLPAYAIHIGLDATVIEVAVHAHAYLYYAQGKNGKYHGVANEIDPVHLKLGDSSYDPAVEPAS